MVKQREKWKVLQKLENSLGQPKGSEMDSL